MCPHIGMYDTPYFIRVAEVLIHSWIHGYPAHKQLMAKEVHGYFFQKTAKAVTSPGFLRKAAQSVSADIGNCLHRKTPPL